MLRNMGTDAGLIERFYTAFAARDCDAMAACYAPGARFKQSGAHSSSA